VTLPDDPAELFAARAAFVPGSAIAWAVLADGRLSAGTTDESHDPVRYQIGSITKVMTGTLLALLAQRGTVKLETRIGDLLARPFVPEVARLTLLDLATHTAGLPRLPPAMRAPDRADPYASFDRGALLGFVAELQTGAIVDGRGSFDYSNFGVSVLGALLEIAAGRPFDELLASELFEPLGMTDSYVARPGGARGAPPGMNGDGEPVPGWTFDAFAPAGGVVSSGADMAAFTLALCLGSSPLAAAMRDAAEPRRALRHGPAVGLCWMCEDTLRWHNGQTYGHHAMIAADVARGRAALALWNAAYPLDDICLHLVRPTRELSSLPVETTLAPIALARYAGTYEKEYPKGARFAILSDGRGLLVEDAMRFRLYAENEHRFFAKQIPGTAFTFELDPDGEARAVEQSANAAAGTALMRARRMR
jgi:CubicO group peptidase (beta-lactamase class C family)